MKPDSIVEKSGKEMTLVRVTDAVFNSHDELDEDASTIEEVTFNAIPSQPSEKDVTLLEGRVAVPELKITVTSGLDVRSDREGRPDQVKYDGYRYEVQEVRDDENPFTGTKKKTVFLTSVPGR